MPKPSKTVSTLLALAFAGAVGAMPLSALFNGGSLTGGDKWFDRWALKGQGPIDRTGAVERDRIDATGVVNGLDVVVSFNAGDELALSGDHQIDLFFGTRASVLPGSTMSITGVAFDLTRGSHGQDGFSAATEDIVDGPGRLPGNMNLRASHPQVRPHDSALFSPVSDLFEQKSILLQGFAPGGSINPEQFNQTFLQKLPVPSTAWLLAAAGVAWFEVKRRRLPKRLRHPL